MNSCLGTQCLQLHAAKSARVIPRTRPGQISTGVIIYNNSFVTPTQRTSDTTVVAGDVCIIHSIGLDAEAKLARLLNSQ